MSWHHIRWPKYWSFSFSISPSNEYSGLISFGIDCFDLLAVQGTPKSLLQYHNSKTSVLCHSAFIMVQFSHLCMTTRKSIALTIWTFVGRVMSLLFNMLTTLATWCKELIHWKRPYAGKDWRQKGMTGWDGWMASPSWQTWVWASSRRWWGTGKPGVLQSMGLRRVRHHWVTEQQQLLWWKGYHF